MNFRKLFDLKLFAAGILILIKFALNLGKIKKAKYIFINSDSFGHSVTDSVLFIETFGQESLVISLGTHFNHIYGTERNKYFDLCLRNNLIAVYFPKILSNNNTFPFLHPLSREILKLLKKAMNSPRIQFYEDKTFVRKMATPKKISASLNCSIDMGKKIYDNLDICVVEGRFHFHPAGNIPFFMQSIQIDSSSLNLRLRRKILKNLEYRVQLKPLVCVSIRRGNAPWHSSSDYYFELIELMNSLGFEVALIGDREYIYELAEKKNFSLKNTVCNLDIDKFQQKYFELIAIQRCAFVVGDQGGVWSLVHAFNKPGLQINTSPCANLQYNVEALPRKWIYQESGVEVLDADLIFNDLFFKWQFNSTIMKSHSDYFTNNSMIKKPNLLIPINNDNSFIFSVVKRYVKELTYLTQLSIPKILEKNFPENLYLRLAKNSSFSKEYLNRLTGLKNI